MSEPINIGIAADPGAGKTTLALYPYEPIAGAKAKVLLIATNAVAYRLKGIPKAWIDGRVTVELAGYEFDEKAGTYGKRRKLGEYFKGLTSYAEKPKTGYDLIVVDDITTLLRCRYNDALELQGGLPSEYRRENEVPQFMANYFMGKLWEANKETSIITLHHAKKVYEAGADRKYAGMWFELVGKALDDTWGGKFDGFFYIENFAEKDVKNPRVLNDRRRLHLKKGKEWEFIISRTGLGGQEFPSSVDLVCESEQNTQPLENAWAAMVAAVGG